MKCATCRGNIPASTMLAAKTRKKPACYCSPTCRNTARQARYRERKKAEAIAQFTSKYHKLLHPEPEYIDLPADMCLRINAPIPPDLIIRLWEKHNISLEDLAVAQFNSAFESILKSNGIKPIGTWVGPHLEDLLEIPEVQEYVHFMAEHIVC